MRLIFSLSNDVNRLCNVQLSDAQSTAESVDVSSCPLSHSTQLSWQFHQLNLHDFSLVIAVESYSRYTLFLPFIQAPNWHQLQSSFFDVYNAEICRFLERGSFMRWHQRGIVDRNFQSMQERILIQSVGDDMSPLLIEAQQSLNHLQGEGLTFAELTEKLEALSVQLNQKPHKLCGNRCNDVFFPLERFLSDILYRFAAGLCDLDLPGCKAGDFPNPYRAHTELRAVRGC